MRNHNFDNHGTDVNAVDPYGKMALSVALGNRKKGREIIGFLLENGMDKTIKNNYGVSAEDTARRFKFEL